MGDIMFLNQANKTEITVLLECILVRNLQRKGKQVIRTFEKLTGNNKRRLICPSGQAQCLKDIYIIWGEGEIWKIVSDLL